MPRRPTLARLLVVTATMLTPLVGGAIIYYALRKTHPKIADFANLMSVAGFAAWTSVMYSDWARHDGRFVLGILGALGVIATELAIRATRNTDSRSHAPSRRAN